MIHISTALQAIEAVEGPDWIAQQTGTIRREGESPPPKWDRDRSLWGAELLRLQLLEEIETEEDPEEQAYLREVFPEKSQAIIYGLGGGHRYYLLGSGEVVFSRGHAYAPGIARAEAQGFRIWC